MDNSAVASDNTSGVAVMLEAMRILKAVGAEPRPPVPACGEATALNTRAARLGMSVIETTSEISTAALTATATG